jgi:hypothetical protein
MAGCREFHTSAWSSTLPRMSAAPELALKPMTASTGTAVGSICTTYKQGRVDRNTPLSTPEYRLLSRQVTPQLQVLRRREHYCARVLSYSVKRHPPHPVALALSCD